MLLMRLKSCNKVIKVYMVYGVDNLQTGFNKTSIIK